MPGAAMEKCIRLFTLKKIKGSLFGFESNRIKSEPAALRVIGGK
jgi:hypothetical protein